MTSQRAERLLDVLRQHAGGVDWELRPVGDRSRTTTFMATRSGRRLFVKWPTVIEGPFGGWKNWLSFRRSSAPANSTARPTWCRSGWITLSQNVSGCERMPAMWRC